MDDLSVYFLPFNQKIMFKHQLIKSNHRVPRKNKVEIYGTIVFAPDDSATVLTAKMCITPMIILCILDFYG
jgi:hypothetical protein